MVGTCQTSWVGTPSGAGQKFWFFALSNPADFLHNAHAFLSFEWPRVAGFRRPVGPDSSVQGNSSVPGNRDLSGSRFIHIAQAAQFAECQEPNRKANLQIRPEGESACQAQGPLSPTGEKVLLGICTGNSLFFLDDSRGLTDLISIPMRVPEAGCSQAVKLCGRLAGQTFCFMV